MRSSTDPLVAVVGAVVGVVVVGVDGLAAGAGTLSSVCFIAERPQHVQPT
jgi:hypothetical protein